LYRTIASTTTTPIAGKGTPTIVVEANKKMRKKGEREREILEGERELNAMTPEREV